MQRLSLVYFRGKRTNNKIHTLTDGTIITIDTVTAVSIPMPNAQNSLGANGYLSSTGQITRTTRSTRRHAEEIISGLRLLQTAYYHLKRTSAYCYPSKLNVREFHIFDRLRPPFHARMRRISEKEHPTILKI